jgi:hypothetical protein
VINRAIWPFLHGDRPPSSFRDTEVEGIATIQSFMDKALKLGGSTLGYGRTDRLGVSWMTVDIPPDVPPKIIHAPSRRVMANAVDTADDVAVDVAT